MKFSVQWNKDKYEVEYTPGDGLESFQAQLFSLTNVPAERQKVMLKGKLLKDAAALDAIKDGDKVMLMGTADPPPAAPAKATVFEEDLSDAQRVGVVKDALSAGLHNMGNTCYMASTLQCLRAVPELKQALIAESRAPQAAQHDAQRAVVRQLGRLLSEMDQTTAPVTPMMFTTTFRSTFPQFAETSPQGHWMQQDAEEAWTQLLSAMANILKKEHVAGTSALENNTVDELFSGKCEVKTFVKGGSSDEPIKVSVESYRRLRCFIEIGIDFLYQGIEKGLVEEVELRGQILERRITLMTLPKYLVINMARFFWKKDINKKSKILRKVDYPLKLDVAQFAHPTLKHQLLQARNLLSDEQAQKLGLSSVNKKPKTDVAQTAGSAPAAAAAAASPAAAAAANPWADSSAMEVDSAAASSASAAAPSLTLTTPTSGNYELIGVVTHQGRDAEGGHYVGYSMQADGAWMKFDDDVVTRTTEDEVKRLSGGGDWPVNYMLFYRRIDDMKKFLGTLISAPSAVKEESKDKPKPAAVATSQ